MTGLAQAGVAHVKALKKVAAVGEFSDFYVHGFPALTRNLSVGKGRNVGFWMWESTELPEWYKKASREYAEIWTASSYCKTIFEQALDLPVKVVPHYLFEEVKQARGNIVPKVLVTFNWHSKATRKNFWFTLLTLQEAKKEAEFDLHFHVSNLPKYAAEAISDYTPFATYSSEPVFKMADLYEECDVLYAPHCSEGFGLHLLEGLASGLRVVTTSYGGCMDFLTKDNSWLIDWELGPVTDDFYKGEWAYVQKQSAVQQLVDAVCYTGKKHLNGMSVKERFSFENTVKAIQAALV